MTDYTDLLARLDGPLPSLREHIGNDWISSLNEEAIEVERIECAAAIRALMADRDAMPAESGADRRILSDAQDLLSRLIFEFLDGCCVHDIDGSPNRSTMEPDDLTCVQEMEAARDGIASIIERPACDAIIAEREACAKACYGVHDAYVEPTDWDYGAQDGCIACAESIRARGPA